MHPAHVSLSFAVSVQKACFAVWVITSRCRGSLGFCSTAVVWVGRWCGLKANLHRGDRDNGDVWSGWGGLTPTADCCLAGSGLWYCFSQLLSFRGFGSLNSCRWIQAEVASLFTAWRCLDECRVTAQASVSRFHSPSKRFPWPAARQAASADCDFGYVVFYCQASR